MTFVTDSSRSTGGAPPPLGHECPPSSTRYAVTGASHPGQVLTLTWAVGFVLLIACVNLANLLLSRSSARRREMGVRSSLGAGRGRLVRQLMTESVLLSSIGAVFGLALAWGGTRLLVTVDPSILPRATNIAIDLQALGFTAGIAVLTGMLFGLAPALHLAGSDLNSALRESGRGNAIGFRRNRLRSMLVIGEVALSLVLLSGAGCRKPRSEPSASNVPNGSSQGDRMRTLGRANEPNGDEPVNSPDTRLSMSATTHSAELVPDARRSGAIVTIPVPDDRDVLAVGPWVRGRD